MRSGLTIGLVTALALALAFAGSAAAAGTPDTAVDATVNETDSETVDIVVRNASGGVGALDANVSLVGPGTITDFGHPGDPLNETRIGTTGRNATLYAAWLGSALPAGEDVTVATLTVTGADDTEVGLDVGALGSASGVEYGVTASDSATLGGSDTTELTVADRNVTPRSGTAPLSVTATATVTNLGETPTNETVELGVDGDTVDGRELSLDGGESRTVSFEHELAVGEHTVSVAGGDPVAVNVSESAASNEPPSVGLSYPDAVISNATVTLNASASTDPDGDELTYRWDTDNDGAFDDGTGETLRETFPNGERTVRVNVSDGRGGSATASARFVVDSLAPTVSVESLAPDAGSAPDEEPVAVSEAFTLTGSVADETETDIAVVLDAVGVNYERRFQANDDSETESFETSVGADALASTGPYDVAVVATDAAGNVERADAGRVVVDREAPDLSATVSPTGPSVGQVRVYSDEALQSAPAVTVNRPDGETANVTLSAADNRIWTGSVTLDATGTYDITVRGADTAGNEGVASAATTVRTGIDTADGIATLSGSDGTFVRMTTDGPVADAYAALTAQSGPTGDLPPGLTGISFLTGELSTALDEGLANATVGIPVRELPGNTPTAKAEIRHFDAANGSWDAVETAVENRTVGGETRQYWTAEVTHFSTYGAVVPDTTPPRVVSASEPNRTFAHDADTVPFRVTYADAGGINDSAVRLALDAPGTEGWTDVTDVPNASVTEAFAAFNESSPTAGRYTLRVTVADAAGNRMNVTRTALVGSDTSAPRLTSRTPANGTTLGANTTALSMSFADAESGVGSLTAYLNGEVVEADVTGDTVRYPAPNLSAGEHVFAVVATDAAGNDRRYESTFTVGGGGGVGFFPSPPGTTTEAPAQSGGTGTSTETGTTATATTKTADSTTTATATAAATTATTATETATGPTTESPAIPGFTPLTALAALAVALLVRRGR